MPFWRRDKEEKALSSVDAQQSWWTRIFDWTPGAWQTHHAYDTSETGVLAHPIVFACITLIQGDVGKLPFCVEQEDGMVWKKAPHPVLDMLRRPNKYQNELQFRKAWIGSKLIHGNTYVLKVREGREIVGLVVLDPTKVQVLVSSEKGEVYYRLSSDELPDIQEQIVVPASEIIHDRDNCLFHPLIGLSPLYAGAESARIGNSIIRDSRGFFNNGARPGGILTAPGEISEDAASRLKEYWESNFTGDKAGKVAVLGDGLHYESMRMTSVDAQLIEQLGWSDEKICSVFHVPAYKVGVGQAPTYNNIEALTKEYYQGCLQEMIQALVIGLNNGLNLQKRFRVNLELSHLFLMDQATQNKMLSEAVGGGWMSPNEAREIRNLPPVEGGNSPYLQQQNYSLEALAKRDADEPFSKPEPVQVSVEQEPDEDDVEMMLAGMATMFRKELMGEFARPKENY